MVYDEKIGSINKTKNVLCNTDTFTNPSCMNQSISPPPVRRQHLERNQHNPAVPMSVTKTLIIDSPLKLAMAGLNDCKEDDRTCEAIEPTEGANRNNVC